jgi:predicted nucleotidyltransferase
MNLYFADKPIQKVYLFGSFARGDADENSDVDLLVDFAPNAFQIGLEYWTWWNELEALIEKKIDFIAEGALSKYVVNEVEKDKKLIYEKRKA